MVGYNLVERPKKYFGLGLPNVDLNQLKGKLITIEGTDGVGRSTQIQLLKEWLEIQGFAVMETGWTRSKLVGKTIGDAKEGHWLNPLTYTLLYTTDFADRLENEIVPALRAGYVVLADRYIFTVFARTKVRNVDPQWIRDLFGFALVPDLVFYLKIDFNTLTRRVLDSNRMDYWEAGMDLNPGLDIYDSFKKYQTQLLREFDQLAKEFNFLVIDGRKSISRIQNEIRTRIIENLFTKEPVTWTEVVLHELEERK
ncbi:MAG: dTMP kinase [Acidobacteria bacterium]|nr:MAG: dTMP kinase [Acidobacteriota bacterium]